MWRMTTWGEKKHNFWDFYSTVILNYSVNSSMLFSPQMYTTVYIWFNTLPASHTTHRFFFLIIGVEECGWDEKFNSQLNSTTFLDNKIRQCTLSINIQQQVLNSNRLHFPHFLFMTVGDDSIVYSVLKRAKKCNIFHFWWTGSGLIFNRHNINFHVVQLPHVIWIKTLHHWGLHFYTQKCLFNDVKKQNRTAAELMACWSIKVERRWTSHSHSLSQTF